MTVLTCVLEIDTSSLSFFSQIVDVFQIDINVYLLQVGCIQNPDHLDYWIEIIFVSSKTSKRI